MVHTLETGLEEALAPGLMTTAMAKGRSAKKAVEEEKEADDEADTDEDDDWEKGEEEDDAWDPDFEEFDLPKSRKGGGKKEADDDDDFKIEEDPEFKDLFSAGGNNGFDDEDEDF